MPFTIEMTLRGVLVAGKWRSEEDCNKMSTEDKRNTLIVELAGHTNQSAGYFQGFNNDALIGTGALVVFVWEAIQEIGVYDRAKLKTFSDDDYRNTLIWTNNNHTDQPVGQLQGMTNQQLVQIGLAWFAKAKIIAAILEFYWNIDQAKVVSRVPDIIETANYDNTGSSHPLKDRFVVKKAITNTSTFSRESGFEISVGVETKFTAGIPFMAENETTVKLDASTKHTWTFGEENSTTQEYSHESEVEVPPHKHIQRVASITRGNLDVPFRTKIRTADGSIRWIEGTWNGVSTANLIVKQMDITLLPT